MQCASNLHTLLLFAHLVALALLEAITRVKLVAVRVELADGGIGVNVGVNLHVICLCSVFEHSIRIMVQ